MARHSCRHWSLVLCLTSTLQPKQHQLATNGEEFISISSSTDITKAMIACANCGKGEAGDKKSLKICAACNIVKYCSRDCQLEHWSQHKAACKKRVHELHDEALFKDPPEAEECPICMLPLPIDLKLIWIKRCCCQRICQGCNEAQIIKDISSGKRGEDVGLCPFCRAPSQTTRDEDIRLLKRHVEENKVDAIYNCALRHLEGTKGFPKDITKAIDLLLKAAELGSANAYYDLGHLYDEGDEVNRDMKKARHYFELAAIGGCVSARRPLACFAAYVDDYERAYRHAMIGARFGDEECLKIVKIGVKNSFVTKDQYAEALQSYQRVHEDRKSETRDLAAMYYANPLLYCKTLEEMQKLHFEQIE